MLGANYVVKVNKNAATIRNAKIGESLSYTRKIIGAGRILAQVFSYNRDAPSHAKRLWRNSYDGTKLVTFIFIYIHHF